MCKGDLQMTQMGAGKAVKDAGAAHTRYREGALDIAIPTRSRNLPTRSKDWHGNRNFGSLVSRRYR